MNLQYPALHYIPHDQEDGSVDDGCSTVVHT